MKSILLASVASVAFAGAAAADVSFSGTAKLGYNSDTVLGNKGFYSDADIKVAFSQTLDNGLTAAASFGIDLGSDGLGGNAVTSGDYVVSLTSDMAGLYFGKTATATEAKYTGGVGKAADGLFLNDEKSADGNNTSTLRGEIKYSVVDAAISVQVAPGVKTAQGIQVAANTTLGGATVAVAYQQAAAIGDATAAKQKVAAAAFGVKVGYTIANANLTAEFANVSNANGSAFAKGSYYGVGISYPVGPVTLGAQYASNNSVTDWEVSAAYAANGISVTAAYEKSKSWKIEGSYAYGSGLTFYAGVIDAGKDYYVAGSYDLGASTSLLVSYAKDGDNDDTDDEVGAKKYQEGATVEVAFKF